ncbi:hypothetical protein PENNAL_c0022G10736 [Penicillium nalgiovense]|uniref:EthD domain-containing protein n=1 Tax=Penicillium nalgiovense TaxID=60175 RepID=A0A1V6YFT9_PENNA|nr:hypothetical protein PENNAL_c0022G10736 [Penicillium nalgiovense]
MTFIELEILEQPSGATAGMYLYLTICGYRKPGMNAEDYRNHMVNTSAPMIKGQMVKYGMGENMDSDPQLKFNSGLDAAAIPRTSKTTNG